MSAQLVGGQFVLDHNKDVYRDLANLSLEEIWLQGKKLDIDLARAVTSATWERSILAPSSIDIWIADPDYALRNKHLPKDISEQAILHFGDREFLVVKQGAQGNLVQLTVEDAPAGYSRRYTKTRKTTGKQSRIEFIYSMLREIVETDVPVFAPSLYAKPLPVRSKAAGKVQAHAALSSSSRLKIKGAYADPEQLRVMSEVLRSAAKYSKDNADAMTCCAMCIIVEAESRNPRNATDHDSVGAFQQRKSTGWKGDLTNIDRQVKNFLLDAPTTPLLTSLRHRGGRSLGQIVQQTQRSAFPDRYDQYRSEARAAVAAFRKTGSVQKDRPSVYARGQQGKPEDTWAASLRLMDEVNTRIYSDMGLVVIADEIMLLDSAPTPVVDVREPEFEIADQDIDWGKKHSALELTVKGWDMPIAPGIPLPIEGAGLANGSWLVESVRGEIGKPDVRNVTLRRPGPPKPEPNAEPEKKTAKSSGKGSAPAKLLKLLDVCQTISDNTPGYLYGGGHGVPLAQINSRMRLDCSSSTSFALYKAGLFPGRSAPIVSGAFSGWGESGNGRWLTVYYNAEHVFLIFTVNGKRYRFDTGGPGGGRGPKLYEGDDASRPTGSFNVRRYRGL